MTGDGPAPVRSVPVRAEGIRLGQLLKLAGVVDSGGQARDLVAEGLVRVNGEPETRRGRQLRVGDVVAGPGFTLRLAAD